MMKKIFSLLSLASVVSALSASNSNCSTGFYVGANVGVNVAHAKSNDMKVGWDAAVDADPAASRVAGGVNPGDIYTGKAGFIGGIFVGYGFGVGPAYLFAELSAFYNGAAPKLSSDNGGNDYLVSYTIRNKFNYDLYVGAGYFVTNSTILYVKAGVEGGQYKVNVASNDSDKTIADTKVLNKNKFRFGVGFGTRVFINRNVFADASVTYVFGPKITTNDLSTITDAEDVQLLGDTTTIKCNAWKFKLGVGYKF